MADRADILPIISAGQSMTGGVLAGAGAANDNTIGVLEDLRDIGRQNEENTQSLLQTMVDMFSFDK